MSSENFHSGHLQRRRSRIDLNTDDPFAVDIAHMLSRFELHYDLDASNGAVDVLETIKQDLSSHRPIHNWDQTLIRDPIKNLVRFVSRELSLLRLSNANQIFNYSTATEIRTVHGRNQQQRAPGDQMDVGSYFDAARKPESIDRSLDHESASGSPFIGFGRIICTKQNVPDAHRTALLLYHAFCTRLRDEDFTFIQRFIQRHLRLRAAYKEPYHLQDLSPSDKLSKHYSRVSVSFHLPHIFLQRRPDPDEGLEVPDRDFLRYFGSDQSRTPPAAKRKGRLYKASTSVLLTLVIPMQTKVAEEATDLLSRPEALWTVLIINGPMNTANGFSPDPEAFLTPLTQFFRGICGALYVQRVHIDEILEELKKRLLASKTTSTISASVNAHLFDDRDFSKSKLYHWIIETCYEVCNSAEQTLKFTSKLENFQLAELRAKAHSYESLGLAHWTTRLTEEKLELDEVQNEVNALKDQARELVRHDYHAALHPDNCLRLTLNLCTQRDALIGATAVLEARATVIQGDRIQLLTYLSMAYLPITTVASLYSMAVLPKDASFVSFIVVLLVVMFITVLLMLNVQKLSQVFLRIIQNSSSFAYTSMRYSIPKKLRRLRLEVLRAQDGPVTFPQNILFYSQSLFRRPQGRVQEVPIPLVVEPKFSFFKLIVDILVLLLFPVWIIWFLLSCGIQLVIVLTRSCDKPQMVTTEYDSPEYEMEPWLPIG